MLNRLPKYAGTLADLLADLGQPKPAAVARALGVSERTVQRWIKSGAPRTALLSLWWLSRAGHDEWDCEMANRTSLALQTNRALWSEVARLRQELVLMTRTNPGVVDLSAARRSRHCANG